MINYEDDPSEYDLMMEKEMWRQKMGKSPLPASKGKSLNDVILETLKKPAVPVILQEHDPNSN